MYVSWGPHCCCFWRRERVLQHRKAPVAVCRSSPVIPFEWFNPAVWRENTVSTFPAGKATVQGWTSLIVLNVIFSGAILTAIGLVGDYLARVYEESKGRPLYIVSRTVNLAPGSRAANGLVLEDARIAYAGNPRR